VARMVIEVSDNHKEVVNAVERLVATIARMGDRAAGGRAIDYAAVEREVGEAVAEVKRAAHEGILRRLDIDAPKISISGASHLRVGRYEQTYYTMAGPVVVERSVPITVAWRMAWVDTVTLHDRNGDAFHTLHYGRMANDGSEALLEAMAGDVRALLEKRPNLKVSLLSDGAHDLVEQLATEVGGRLSVKPTQLVDFWHLVEKLASAARVMGGDAHQRTARWKLRLLNVEYAAGGILGELRASGGENVRVGETRPVHDAITYIESHRTRMNYAAARAAGLPIGSGNVEATCKTLVQVRMKRAGSRWKTRTGGHVLQLRALALSDRWAEAMDLTLRPLRRSVRRVA